MAWWSPVVLARVFMARSLWRAVRGGGSCLPLSYSWEGGRRCGRGVLGVAGHSSAGRNLRDLAVASLSPGRGKDDRLRGQRVRFGSASAAAESDPAAGGGDCDPGEDGEDADQAVGDRRRIRRTGAGEFPDQEEGDDERGDAHLREAAGRGGAAVVVFVAVFAVLFLGERLSLPNWLGVVLIACGAVLMAYRG